MRGKKQTNMTPEDNQIKQVSLSFFTKTVAYLESDFDFTSWERFEFTNLNYLWALKPSPLEKL